MVSSLDDETKTQKTLRLFVKGFTGFDERLIDGVIKLSQRRNPSLELVDASRVAEGVDVVMINGKDPQSMAWAQGQQTWLAKQAVVWVDALHELPQAHTKLQRPVHWTNLPLILAQAIDNAVRVAGGGPAAPATPTRTAAPSVSGAEKQGLAAAAARLSGQASPSPDLSMQAPVPASNLRAGPVATQAGVPTAPGNAPSILVVDDSAAVRGHLESALKTVGYDVTSVDSGEAAIMAAGARAYACILMDVLMPGIDGYEASRRIKAMPLNGRGARPAIVMLTSKSSPFDRIRGKLAGCDAYLTKPVQRSHLMQVLAEHAFKNFQEAVA